MVCYYEAEWVTDPAWIMLKENVFDLRESLYSLVEKLGH